MKELFQKKPVRVLACVLALALVAGIVFGCQLLFDPHDNRIVEGVSIGDGPIDAAFLAIEQITGKHYELDDFQIQAVTEGREAMGQTVVKLRDHGKVFSGRGISTDIVGASIRAYLSALNKIVYEEEAV